MSRERLRALILDDGDLTEVRDALGHLGVTFLEAERGAEPVAEDGEFPLLVTTPARARALSDGDRKPRHHLHLVVAEHGGEAIDGVRCDFLVQRPVCPEVLRLLVERADYEGPERRRMTRVAIGIPVRVHTSGRSRELVMVQLSTGGCGLVTAQPLDMHAPVRIELPEEVTHPRRLELWGHVLSSRSVRTADGPNFDVSIAFEPLSLSDRITLRAAMAEQPIDFHPHRSAPAGSAPPRRGARRRLSLGRRGVSRVVIGRNPTGDGMRIERDPALALGDTFELAIYFGGHREPIAVCGRVEGDDGDEGWRIAFEDVSAEAKAALEDRRGTLSSDASESAGFVIAEILEA